MGTRNYTAQEAKVIIDELVAPTTDTVGAQEKASITRLRGQFGDIATAKITGSWGDQAYYKSTKYLGTAEPGSPRVRELLQELDRNRPPVQNAARDDLDTRFAAAIKNNPQAIDRFEDTLRQDPSLKGRFIDLIANHPGKVSDEALRAIVTGNSQTIKSTIDQTLAAAKAAPAGPATTQTTQAPATPSPPRPPARAAGAGPAGQRGGGGAAGAPSQGTPQRTAQTPTQDTRQPAAVAADPSHPAFHMNREVYGRLTTDEQVRWHQHLRPLDDAYNQLDPALRSKLDRVMNQQSSDFVARGETERVFSSNFTAEENAKLGNYKAALVQVNNSISADTVLMNRIQQVARQGTSPASGPATSAPAPMASALAEMTRQGQILAGIRGFAAELPDAEQRQLTRHFDGANRAFGDLSPELQQKVGRRLAEDMASGRTFDRNRFELAFNEQERRQLQDFSGNMMRSMESLQQDEALHQKFTQHMTQRSETASDPMSAITNDPDFSEALKAMGPEAGAIVLRRLAEENRKDPGFAEKIVSLRDEYPQVFQNMMRQVGEGKKREGETPEQLNQRLNQMLTQNMSQLKQLAQFDGMKDALVSIVGMFSPEMAQWLDTKLTGLVGQAATNPTLSNLFGRMAQNMPGGQPSPQTPAPTPPPPAQGTASPQGAQPPAGAQTSPPPAQPPAAQQGSSRDAPPDRGVSNNNTQMQAWLNRNYSVGTTVTIRDPNGTSQEFRSGTPAIPPVPFAVGHETTQTTRVLPEIPGR